MARWFAFSSQSGLCEPRTGLCDTTPARVGLLGPTRVELGSVSIEPGPRGVAAKEDARKNGACLGSKLP